MNASNLDWIMMRLLWIVSNREMFVQQVALRRFLRKGDIWTYKYILILPEVVFQSTFISLLDNTCFCLSCLFVIWLCQVFLLHQGFLQLQREGAALQLWCKAFLLQWLLLWSTDSRACRFSGCGTQAQLHCGMWDLSSQTKYQTCVPCICRQILNHQATREIWIILFSFWPCLMACGILVPESGIELTPSPLEGQSLNYQTAREVL